MKYFVERNPSRLGIVSRYHILNGTTVIEIRASRPDGQEVPPPAGVKWKLKPLNGTAVEIKIKKPTFHNVPAEIAEIAGKRAGEAYRKRMKWNGGKR